MQSKTVPKCYRRAAGCAESFKYWIQKTIDSPLNSSIAAYMVFCVNIYILPKSERVLNPKKNEFKKKTHKSKLEIEQTWNNPSHVEQLSPRT